jgi:hypothetical protein
MITGNDHRHHCPQHLDHGIVGCPGRRRIAAGIEADHHIDQQRQHQQRDARDDHDQKVVEVGQLFLDRRGGGLEPELPGLRRADHPVFGGGNADAAEQGKHDGR